MKLLFFFFLSSFSLLIPITEAQPLVLCGENNYTLGSPYQSNLKVVINSLVSNIITSGFYMNTSAGTDPDKVYGLLQCRAGISNADCQSCANYSSAEIVKQCSYKKDGIFMQYETCVLRYAGTEFFGKEDEDVQEYPRINPEKASDQVVFRNELDDLLDKLSAKAASNSTRLFSGSNATKYDIYGMVQCTRDLPEANCFSCLKRLSLKIDKVKIGGRYVTRSCFIQYENRPFFGIPLSSFQRTDPNSPNQGSGNENNQRNIILATVIPIVIVSIFVATTCVFLLRRKHRRKKHGYVEMDISHTNSLTFHLDTLRLATNNFSESNNLGE